MGIKEMFLVVFGKEVAARDDEEAVGVLKYSSVDIPQEPPQHQRGRTQKVISGMKFTTRKCHFCAFLKTLAGRAGSPGWLCTVYTQFEEDQRVRSLGKSSFAFSSSNLQYSQGERRSSEPTLKCYLSRQEGLVKKFIIIFVKYQKYVCGRMCLCFVYFLGF